MSKSSAGSVIRLRGVRQNNLKNFDLDLPLKQLIVITGLSGSGKSSLAFDTLFAEGQRRYVETFSPYARQFFDRMDKPQVHSIEGILPAIAIEQRNSVRTTRSTVGTLTELCDYMKMLWPHISQLHCRQCGRPVRKDSPQTIWEALTSGDGAAKHSASSPRPSPPEEEREKHRLRVQSKVEESHSSALAEGRADESEILIAFDLPLSEKLSLEESVALISKQGYQHLLSDGQVLRLDELGSRFSGPSGKSSAQANLEPISASRRARGKGKQNQHIGGLGSTSLTVAQDRLRLTPGNRARFIEACEQAYHFGKGKLVIYELNRSSRRNELRASQSSGQPLPIESLVELGPSGNGVASTPTRFSNRLHCAECDIEYREPTPALFSFNNPVGACPTCRGFGRIITIDYQLALPDRSKTIAGGVVKPWQVGHGLESQNDLMRACRALKIPTNVPFNKLPEKWQKFVIEGDPKYGADEEHEWPRAWYGVKGYFRWLESKAYKMHVRVLLSRYRAYTPCPDCHGQRFQPETLLYSVAAGHGMSRSLTLADFYLLPIRDALRFIQQVSETRPAKTSDPLGIVLNEVRSRLDYLEEVGLGYLTLDRPTRSLSGGEIERVSLTTCLGSRLVNTLFVLDEPSVGLHPRDTQRLVRILEQLRNAGNTVIVVEHEASVMRAADQIVDLGPGHGATGGEVVFQGTFREILRARNSLTGDYLSGRKRIELPERRLMNMRQSPGQVTYSSSRGLVESPFVLNDAPVSSANAPERCPVLRLSHASKHNLKDLSVEIPLQRFVCVTGVSGSGKTTLVREVLLPALEAKLSSSASSGHAFDQFPADQSEEGEENGNSMTDSGSVPLEGTEFLGGVTLVDQSILGKTPRSNPAVYVGAFDDIREFFAQSEIALQRGLNASAFSFNSIQGQCERCRGAGFEKIEMQFLSDVFIRCPECNGRRYRPHILEVKVSPKSAGRGTRTPLSARPARLGEHRAEGSVRALALSIADLLESTVEEAAAFLARFPESRPAARALAGLKLLQEVGLGYLRLGQPINTLSGGESQRLKLVRHLAESNVATSAEDPEQKAASHGRCLPGRTSYSLQGRSPNRSLSTPHCPHPTLFLFDEPTTGLHFDDVRVVLKVFQRLVDAGHSVLVIEHNLDVIKSADWVIDLGPEAGEQGGYLVAQGTPEEIALSPISHTGKALREILTGLVPELQRDAAPDGLIIPETKSGSERIAEHKAS
jgi:excinuclease ABC subunit A